MLQGSYLLNVLVFIGINTMLAVALNLLLGFAGQISLGHAAFFGLGAYISGILTTQFASIPWLAMAWRPFSWVSWPLSSDFPILKLKGHYLAMATLGFGIIIYIVFNETVDWTGGPSGMSGIPNLSVGPLVFDSDMTNFYLIWAFTLPDDAFVDQPVPLPDRPGSAGPSTIPKWPPGSWALMPGF